jgi:hypothetical protein
MVIKEDNLFGPDGLRYTGLIKLIPIESSVVQGALFIDVTDGVLQAQVSPSREESYYVAMYYRGDRVIKVEKWVIPLVGYELRIDDIKQELTFPLVINTAASSQAAAAPYINQSDVIGLIADLGARPVRGPSYAPGRVALINSSGLLESVTGSPSDCVRVDGTSAPCGGSPDGTTASGAVISVFGRTGAIQPAVTDYADHYELKDSNLLRSNGLRNPLSLTAYDAVGKIVSTGCTITADALRCNLGPTAGMLSLKEAGAGGHTFSFAAKDSMAGPVCLVMPDTPPTVGQLLAATGATELKVTGESCVVMTWMSVSK